MRPCSMRNKSAPVSALAVAVLLWGSTFVVSDTALESMSPAVLTVARFAVALLVVGPAAAARGGFIAMIRSAPVALLGATGVAAYYGLQNLGLLTTGAGTAAVLQALLPVATGLIAVVWLRERLSRALVAGLGLATVGVTLVAGQVVTEASPGAALIAVGVLAYAVYTVLLRRQPDRDPVVLAAATCLWGLVFLVPWLAGEVLVGDARFELDSEACGALAYLGLLASALTLLLWTYGASRLPASTAGVFTASIPAVGYLCAVVTGEPSSWAKTVGSVLALLGAGIAARAGSPANPPEPQVIGGVAKSGSIDRFPAAQSE
jgi:drug/metabolite transporter (DMT)-like permease